MSDEKKTTNSVETTTNIKGATAIIPVHRNTIRRWIDNGTLPAQEYGERKTVILLADLEKLKK